MDLWVPFLIWTLAGPILVSSDGDYDVIPMEADWENAAGTCKTHHKFLLPDLGIDVLQSKIAHKIKVEETFWINAKSVKIMYKAGPEYLKFAYQSVETKLRGFICFGAVSKRTRKHIESEPLSWDDAFKKCRKSAQSLYTVAVPSEIKVTVPMLNTDVTFWLNKIPENRLPSMGKHDMTEDCLALTKLADGSLEYRRDNCTNEHKYICVSSTTEFALTITKMSKPIPKIHEKIDEEEVNNTLASLDKQSHVEDSGISVSLIGGIVGGTVGGVIIISVIAVYVYCRWQGAKEYRRSLHRYTHRQASTRKLFDDSLSRSLPSTTTFDSYAAESLKITEEEPTEYEEVEKRHYVQCQKDVVRDLKFRHAKVPLRLPNPGQDRSASQSTVSHGSARSELENLPGYHKMDGKKALRLGVLPAYESYDPDPHHIHNYENKGHQPKLSDLDQYDNLPKLPEKAGKLNALDELDQYENHSASSLRVENATEAKKPLDDTDQNRHSTLEDLEQYENYKVPKRNKGLFQLFRANKAREAAEAAKRQANTKPDSLDDLEAYEFCELQRNYETKNVRGDCRDAYENYTLNTKMQ